MTCSRPWSGGGLVRSEWKVLRHDQQLPRSRVEQEMLELVECNL